MSGSLTAARRSALAGLALLAAVALWGHGNATEAAAVHHPGRFQRPLWGDLDGNGRDTRADVIAAHCAVLAWNASGKAVKAAECLDVYSGATVTTDQAARALQVDHLYPASVAWHARAWHGADGAECATAKTCREFALFFNDPGNLNVTRARTNERKGDKGPGAWCPALAIRRADLAAQYAATAAKWRLPIARADIAGLDAWRAGKCAPGAVTLGGVARDGAIVPGSD